MEIKAQKREQLGKSVKNSRVGGRIPAVVYGKGFVNLNLSIDLKDFKNAYKEAGQASVVDLSVEGGEEPIKVLIADLQREPLDNEIIHVDFHKINLSEKTSAAVPINLRGESPVVKSGEGILLTLLDEIEIEALPLDLPHRIEVDISKLEKIGDGVTIKDLPIDHAKVKVLEHEADDLVVKIDYAIQIEKEEEVKGVEEVEVLKEKKEGEEGAEGKAEAETGSEENKNKDVKPEPKSEKEQKK